MSDDRYQDDARQPEQDARGREQDTRNEDTRAGELRHDARTYERTIVKAAEAVEKTSGLSREDA